MKGGHKELIQKYTKEIGLCLVLILLFCIFSLVNPERFLSLNNFKTMMKQMPELGLLTMAIMLVILTGGNNLSNVATASLSGIISALVMRNLNSDGDGGLLCVVAGLVVGLVVALLCGALNGLFAAIIGVAAMLATLASSTFFEGISMNVTQGAAISGFPEIVYQMSRAEVAGIPVLFWIFIICAVIAQVLLTKTRWGRTVYMLGSNEVATEYSGITVKKELFKVYLLSAVFSFVAGIVMISRYNSAKVDYGSSYLLQSLTATVLGGVDISGGNGSIAGCVIAVMILQVISSGMNILNINRFFTDIITGAILITVLAFHYIAKIIKVKRAGKIRD